MQIGVDSFGAVISDPATGLTVSAVQRMDNLLDEIVLADQIFASGSSPRVGGVLAKPTPIALLPVRDF